jgi:cytochrome c-type biogenesis protein CcmH
MRESLRFALGVLMLALLAFALHAKEAAPLSNDPALEARVMKVAEELRCLVCQNETIAASQAELAVDLRKQIRLKLQQGQSEAQILEFMVARYGEFVRYRPAFSATTALLWAGPFALLVFALYVLWRNIQRRRADAVPRALSQAEAQRVAELLGDGAAPR